jgi:hypothetical protein
MDAAVMARRMMKREKECSRLKAIRLAINEAMFNGEDLTGLYDQN